MKYDGIVMKLLGAGAMELYIRYWVLGIGSCEYTYHSAQGIWKDDYYGLIFYKLRNWIIRGRQYAPSASVHKDGLDSLKQCLHVPSKAVYIYLVYWDPKKCSISHYIHYLLDSNRTANEKQSHQLKGKQD